MKSTGALSGKLFGYVFCYKKLIDEDLEMFKKDLINISKIMIPYQICNYGANTTVMYLLQKNSILDSSDTFSTMTTILAVDTLCVLGRYKMEHKFGILK